MTNEIVKQPAPGALANLPEDLRGSAGQGTEGLGKDDVRPPRLALAQAGNPQMKRGNPKYIEGLHEGDLFNDLTGQNYGQGPLEVVIVRFLGQRAIQFGDPRKGEPVIVDFEVPLGDARLEFRTDPDNPKKRLKPVATLFYEYLAFLPATQELVAFSMKNTAIKVAINLNSLLKYPLVLDGAMIVEPPAWARTFLLGTAMKSDDNYTWATFTLAPKGVTQVEVRQVAAVLFNAYRDKNVVVEHADEVETSGRAADRDGDVPF